MHSLLLRFSKTSKFVLAASLTAGLLSICTIGFTVSAQNFSNQNLSTDRIIVKFKENTSKNIKDQIIASAGKASEHITNPILKLPNEVIIKVNNSRQAAALVQSLNKNPNIEYAEIDEIKTFRDGEITNVQAAGDIITNDYYPQWHHDNIQAPTAWVTSTGQNVIVAVCDTGVQSNHPDLAANLRADLGFNIFSGTKIGWDILENPHGTMVSGTVSAVANNSVGGKGTAFGAKIMPLKVSSDSTGSTSISYLASCIRFAADNGAKVINVSYDAAGSSSIAYASSYANSKGSTVVVSAGNSASLLNYSNYTNFIAVSATTETNTLASFSDYGNYVDLSAPGTNIITTYWQGGYASVNGTSFSSPITAAVAALILQTKPNLTPAQIQSILKKSANDLGPTGYDTKFGFGKVNALNAVNLAKSQY